MAGNTQVVVVDGQEFDATPEALQELTRRGIQYSAPERGKWESLAETLGDTLRGTAHGASFGLADAKFGEDNQSILQRMGLDDYDAVTQRSPIASTIGDVAGSVVSPLSKIGAAAKGASLATKGVRAAVGSGLEGATRELAEGGNTQDAIQASTIGAALGGGSVGLGKLGAMGAEKVKATGQKVGEWLGREADAMRLMSAGVGNAERQALGKVQGGAFDAPATAKLIEEMTPSPGVVDMTPAERAALLESKRDAVGPQIDQFLANKDQAEGINSMIPTYWQEAQQKMQQWADSLPTTGGKEGQLSRAAQAQAERFAQEAAPTSSVGLRGRKSSLQSDGHSGTAGAIPDQVTARVDAQQGKLLKEALGQTVDAGLPGSLDEFNALNDEYSKLALLQEFADKKANTSAGNALIPGTVGAIGGGVLGANYAEDPMDGFLIGAAGGAFTGTRNFATQALSTPRALGTMANIARKGETKLTAAGPGQLDRFAQALSQGGGGPIQRTLAARAGENLEEYDERNDPYRQ